MNLPIGDGVNLDQLLEAQLERELGSISGPTPGFAQSAYHAAHRASGQPARLRRVRMLASSRVTAGLAVAALAVGGSSMAAAAATGSTNPAVWSRTVAAAVTGCRGELTAGAHALGQCVSEVARARGAAERSDHASKGQDSDHARAAAGDHPRGQANGRQKDLAPSDAPRPSPAAKADDHGRPQHPPAPQPADPGHSTDASGASSHATEHPGGGSRTPGSPKR